MRETKVVFRCPYCGFDTVEFTACCGEVHGEDVEVCCECEEELEDCNCDKGEEK